MRQVVESRPGRMVGASIGAAAAFGLQVFLRWLVSIWLGSYDQDTGAEIGGEIATMMEDCDEIDLTLEDYTIILNALPTIKR